MSDSTNWELPGPTNSLPSQPVPSTTSNKLKIYQWNAEGIGPKLLELRDRLLNSDTNVLAVQESKLRKTDKTKLHPSKVTRQSERTETTFLVAISYSSSERTSCLRSYTPLKKLVWRFYLFVSKLLNHLGLISTTSIYQIPRLNILRSTLP